MAVASNSPLRSRGERVHFMAIPQVSWSAKASIPTTERCARAATKTRKRPDSEVSRKALGGMQPGLAQTVGKAQIKRAIRTQHGLQQALLNLVFDVADGERTDSHVMPGGGHKRLAIVHDADPFDPGWRDCFVVGCLLLLCRVCVLCGVFLLVVGFC